MRGDVYVSDAPPDACEVVDLAMKTVVDVVLSREVGHRDSEPDSLARIDPCDIVSDRTVTANPGFESAEQRRYPSAHACSWKVGERVGSPAVWLTFVSGHLFDSEKASKEPIAGRPSVRSWSESSGDAHCFVYSPHISFNGASGASGLVEIVRVSVFGVDSADAACDVAVDVATEAWPQLPDAT